MLRNICLTQKEVVKEEQGNKEKRNKNSWHSGRTEFNHNNNH